MYVYFWLLVSLVTQSCKAETKQQWLDIAQDELKDALKIKENTNVAKNVILFIGDGMSMSSVTAGRILKGQETGQSGQQPLFSFEKFPHVALSKTHNNDRQTAGSASTGTAYQCGVKANYGTIGVSPNVSRKDCEASKKQDMKLTCLHKWMADEGKSTGFITTARVTHASPAAGYANSADRNWEGTDEVKKGCQDIAAQLFDNLDLKVIMGGGRRYILLNNQTDPQDKTIHNKQRTDGRDLIKEWKNKASAKGKTASYVYDKGQFDNVDASKTDYLLGLFASSHMSYDLERDKTSTGEPSLAEMTRKAIKILKKNTDGFYLFVEGARIDHGHHANQAKRALFDVLSLDEAVKAAKEETNSDDTLIVVSSDHSHVFNIAGYPSRQNDIFGFVDIVPKDEAPFDKFPYTTLIYGNGPGPYRTDLTGVDTKANDFRQPSAVRMTDDTHGAEDVAIYADGPMSHLFQGVHHQHYIPHAMAYASCVGSNKKHCTEEKPDPCKTAVGSKFNFSIVLLLTTLLLTSS